MDLTFYKAEDYVLYIGITSGKMVEIKIAGSVVIKKVHPVELILLTGAKKFQNPGLTYMIWVDGDLLTIPSPKGESD